MTAEPLCIRTFAEVVRTHMNKKSTIKLLNGSEKFQETGQEVKDASGVFAFYSLLLESLAHAYTIEGATFPDVPKQLTTYLKNAQSEVPNKFVEAAQNRESVSNVSTCFSMNLIPNITKASLPIVLDAVLAITQQDSGLGKTRQQDFKKWRKEKSDADFLAEAFVLAVRSGKNKIDVSSEIADEIAPLLKNIDDIQAKLNALPRLETLTPPAEQESHERAYITALLDAYDNASDASNPPSDALSAHPRYEKDLRQRRIEYFAAEAVRRGTRENFRNSDPDALFAALMSETNDGVSDVHAMDYQHGFERLLKVMAHAANLQLNSLLTHIPDWVGPSQKKGVCHMLVNEGEIKGWVDDDE